MTAHVLVLARPDPENADIAKRYAEGVQPLLAAAGIAPTLRGPVAEALAQTGAGTDAGAEPPATAMMLDFPDVGAARAFFAQPAYQALIPLRDAGFLRMDIYLVG